MDIRQIIFSRVEISQEKLPLKDPAKTLAFHVPPLGQEERIHEES
jgi:hypothetical protein